MLNETEMKL